jgi:hypothetical protein
MNIYGNGYFATISIGVANRRHISLSAGDVSGGGI